jgi:hypothetical protein
LLGVSALLGMEGIRFTLEENMTDIKTVIFRKTI